MVKPDKATATVSVRVRADKLFYDALMFMSFLSLQAVVWLVLLGRVRLGWGTVAAVVFFFFGFMFRHLPSQDAEEGDEHGQE